MSNYNRIVNNKICTNIIAMMHSESEYGVKAQCRISILTKLNMHRIDLESDKRLDDEIRVKIIKKRERDVKTACNRLVRLGQLRSKQCKGTRLYALPCNEAYL